MQSSLHSAYGKKDEEDEACDVIVVDGDVFALMLLFLFDWISDDEDGDDCAAKVIDVVRACIVRIAWKMVFICFAIILLLQR